MRSKYPPEPGKPRRAALCSLHHLSGHTTSHNTALSVFFVTIPFLNTAPYRLWLKMSEQQPRNSPSGAEDVKEGLNAPINIKARLLLLSISMSWPGFRFIWLGVHPSCPNQHFRITPSMTPEIYLISHFTFKSGCNLPGRWNVFQDQKEHKAQ